MSLTLVTGRANTGKTGILHGALRRAVIARSPIALLLPTMPDVRRAEDELAGAGLVGARIAVLDSWLDELWGLHGDGRRIISPGARRVLLARAVGETPLRELRRSAEAPGFLALLADVVRRLTRVPSGRRQGTAGEVAAVLERYHELASAEGLVERAVASRLLADDPPVVGSILVNRFTDLSEAQELALSGLAERNEVALALTWEPDLPATAALDALVERMFDPGDLHPSPSRDAPGERAGDPRRAALLPGEAIVPAGQLAVGLATGDEAECVLAARSARRLVDEGVAPERVAVVFRDAARRLGLLAAAFASEDLPVDLDVALPVSATSLGSAFGTLVGACIEPDRERLLALLLSPYADADPSEVAETDAKWRRHRVGGRGFFGTRSCWGR